MSMALAVWGGEAVAFAHKHRRVVLAGVGLGMVAAAALVGFPLLLTLVHD